MNGIVAVSGPGLLESIIIASMDKTEAEQAKLREDHATMLMAFKAEPSVIEIKKMDTVMRRFEPNDPIRRIFRTLVDNLGITHVTTS